MAYDTVCTEHACVEKVTTHVYHGDEHGDTLPRGRDTVPLRKARNLPTCFRSMTARGRAETPFRLRSMVDASLDWPATWPHFIACVIWG